MRIDTTAQVEAAEKVLRLSWVIVFGVILFSVFTVTPLVERSTPPGWEWSAPILPLVVDVAVVISIRVDAIVSRLGGSTTGWPLALRVLTGGTSVALNIGHSALLGDRVGVGVHMAAPVTLIVVAEASLKWRKEIAAATARIERERQEAEAARRREHREREDEARAEREREREEARAEREQQATAAREQRRDEAAEREREREHAARIAREEREHQAALNERHEEREDARRREEQERQDRERARERQPKEHERQRENAAHRALDAARRTPALAAVSPAVSTPRPIVSTPVSTPRPAVSTRAHESAHDDEMPSTGSEADAHEGAVSTLVSTPAQEAAHGDEAPSNRKMSEADARRTVVDAIREGRSQRQVAALTGWSTGWVAKRFQELSEEVTV